MASAAVARGRRGGRVRYYLRLAAVQLRASTVTGLQYRADFLVQGLMSLYWLGWNLLPLLVLYDERATVAGWSFGAALVVMANFVIIRGVLEGAVNPSLGALVEQIRSGAFDYTLLRPADAQFLVSTARFAPWRIVDVLGGVGLLVYAFVRLGQHPSVGQVAAGVGLLVAGLVVMYALWIMIVAMAFWVVKMDNLIYLLGSVFDAARWPASVFRGAWRVVFTFVVPLALMTTYPAQAMLGTLTGGAALACLAGALGLAAVSRLVWRLALRSYTSASS
ncbi:MAG: ABC-2 family transporter protein [Kofleriaceae bacterium]